MKINGLPFFILIIVLLFPAFSPGKAPSGMNEPIPGSIIVRLQEGLAPADFIRAQQPPGRSTPGLRHRKILDPLHNIHLFTFDPAEINGEALLEQVRRSPRVLATQFDYRVEFRLQPDDPYFDRQNTLARIGIPAVWDITTGGLTARGDTIVIAVLDSGFNPEHPDLKGNVWHNTGDLPGDGIDNDNNGYTDDIEGWNFVDQSPDHPRRLHGHQVAGILGATGNNDYGIAGINWNAKLMLCTIDRVSEIIEAYAYVIQQRKWYNETQGQKGAFVVATNASFGQERVFCESQPVWGQMYDLLGEVGILTGAGTANRNYNVEEVGDMPTTCPSPFLLSVLNLDQQDRKYQICAYGPISIDMGTPGQGSGSIALYDEFGIFEGTSAAAPHLTGAIALLYSLPCSFLAEDALTNPAETALYIRRAILQSVDPLPGLANLTATGGRLNAFRAMELISQDCTVKTGPLDILNVFPNPTTGPLTVQYESPDFEVYQLEIFNALGQLLYKTQQAPLRLGDKKFQLELRNFLSPGTYFLRLRRGKDFSMRKFVFY